MPHCESSRVIGRSTVGRALHITSHSRFNRDLAVRFTAQRREGGKLHVESRAHRHRKNRAPTTHCT